MSKNKTAIAIALILMFAMAISLIALPAANAHDPPWEIVTYAFISTVPNDVVGVNQDVVLVFWLDKIMPTALGSAGDRWRFFIDVTLPDGSKDTLGGSQGFESDPVGGGWAIYTPTQVGTYSFVTRFPGQTLTGEPAPPPGTTPRGTEYIGDIYLPATSTAVYVNVQEEPVTEWPESPLPIEYWERPISDASRQWSMIAGNWFGSTSLQQNGPTSGFAWGEGPESAHIMWTKPYWSGGIMDERYGDIGFQTSHYHGLRFQPPIILDGKIFYNVMSYPREGWICRDLYTGEELYFHNTTGEVVGIHGRFDDPGSIAGETLSYGQVLVYECPNQHGGFPYLWSASGNPDGTWMMFDGFTGNYICSIANVSSGTMFMDGIGSICYLNIRNLGTSSDPDRYLQIWNTTQAIWYEDSWNSNEYWMWRPDLNQTFDGNNGFSLNVSVPDVTGSIRAIRPDEYVIGGSEGRYDDERNIPANLWCISLKPGEEGKLLWDIEFTPPKGIPEMALQDIQYSSRDVSMELVDPEDGVVFFSQDMTGEWWCYSIDSEKTGIASGSLVWGPSEPLPQMSFYGMSCRVYDGKMISYASYSGDLRAYDIKTGDVLWIYNASSVGNEAPYGNYPLSIGAICDGKIYTYTSEHSDTHPLFRGPNLRCINASNGAELWKILDFGSGLAIADGRLVKLNSMDNQIYCYGKGPSSTVVSIQDNVIVHGNSVLITGKVTDVSPGTEQHELALRFPNGVPAISDNDMSAWMEYLYQDQAMPTAAGVEVKLETLDPNGNFYEIGNATSDASGNYAYAFTPDVPGLYTIIATFEGTNSYYRSYAETYVNVEEAPQASPTAPPPEPSMADIYFMPATIGVIIAIVAVGLVLVLMLRKR